MEKLYREVKCSERLPDKKGEYLSQCSLTEQIGATPFNPDDKRDVAFWEHHTDWWLEPIENPEVEQSQVGEEEIDKATTEYIESISDKDNRYINIQVNHVWAAAIKWYQSNYPTHPTPKKVPTTWGELSEKEKRPYLECAEQITSDLLFCTKSWTAWSLDTMTEADFISAGEDKKIVNQAAEAIHSLLPDHNILQREGVKLLEWALSICNEIQSKKTYGNRFPETASLGSAIEEYLSDQSKPTK